MNKLKEEFDRCNTCLGIGKIAKWGEEKTSVCTSCLGSGYQKDVPSFIDYWIEKWRHL